MKVKLKQLINALNDFRYTMTSSTLEEMEVEITLTEQDVSEGRLVSALGFKSSFVEPPTQYSKSEKHKTMELEIFDASENRDPQITETVKKKILT